MVENNDKQVTASDNTHTSELSIYVLKKTVTDESGDKVTFDVGQNGRTYLVDGDRATALEKIGEILDEM